MLDDGVSLRQSLRDLGDLGFLKYFGIVNIFNSDVQRYGKLVSYYSDTVIDQRKIRWLERDLNSHLRVSRPPLYPLSYRVNGDW